MNKKAISSGILSLALLGCSSSQVEPTVPKLATVNDEDTYETTPTKENDKPLPQLCAESQLSAELEPERDERYRVLVNGRETVLMVNQLRGTCSLYLGDGGFIFSDKCDGIVNEIFSLDLRSTRAYRKELEKMGFASQFDGLMKQGLKYTCPENRIKPELETRLEKILEDWTNTKATKK